MVFYLFLFAGACNTCSSALYFTGGNIINGILLGVGGLGFFICAGMEK